MANISKKQWKELIQYVLKKENQNIDINYNEHLYETINEMYKSLVVNPEAKRISIETALMVASSYVNTVAETRRLSKEIYDPIFNKIIKKQNEMCKKTLQRKDEFLDDIFKKIKKGE